MMWQSCSSCLCNFCLYWWSSRCPYGGCYDDHRAKIEPREKITGEHWTAWSNCEKPGEQDHWCRGGHHRITEDCEHFVQYEGQEVKECVRANYSEFQDGYKNCTLMPCERCIKGLSSKLKGEVSGEENS